MKILLILILFASAAQAQYIKGNNAAGSKVVRYPNFTVSNTLANSGVEKSLLPSADTIFASTVSVGSVYRFSLQVNITSPLLSVGTLTLKIKLGSSTIILTNGVGVNSLGGTTPIFIAGEVEMRGMNSQIINARLVQWNGAAIPTSAASMNPQAEWTNDMTQDQTFDITATFTGLTLGTTSYTSKIFRRVLEQ